MLPRTPEDEKAIKEIEANLAKKYSWMFRIPSGISHTYAAILYDLNRVASEVESQEGRDILSNMTGDLLEGLINYSMAEGANKERRELFERFDMREKEK